MLLSKCAICNTKKSRFIKKQETRGILSSLGLEWPLRFHYLVIFCFRYNSIECSSIEWLINYQR